MLGLGQFTGTLRAMSDFVLDQAKRRQSVVKINVGEGREVPNPWIVDRASKASDDPWLREFVIEMTMACHALFDHALPGVVSLMASVASEIRISEATVRGMTRGLAKSLELK